MPRLVKTEPCPKAKPASYLKHTFLADPIRFYLGKGLWSEDWTHAKSWTDARAARKAAEAALRKQHRGTYSLVINPGTKHEMALEHRFNDAQAVPTEDLAALALDLIKHGDPSTGALLVVCRRRIQILEEVLSRCRDIGPCYCDWNNGIVCPCAELRDDIKKVIGG